MKKMDIETERERGKKRLGKRTHLSAVQKRREGRREELVEGTNIAVKGGGKLNERESSSEFWETRMPCPFLFLTF